MTRVGRITLGWMLAVFLLAGPVIARAQAPAGGGDATELAKASQNPVGDLISLPFQTTMFNGRPMSLGVQYYYNVKRPDTVAATQLRFVVSLLYPTAKK